MSTPESSLLDSYPHVGGQRNRSFFLHPLFLFSSVWCLVTILYSLRLSDLLLFSNTDVRMAVVYIALPFVVGVLAVTLIGRLLAQGFPAVDSRSTFASDHIERRLTVLFRMWI